MEDKDITILIKHGYYGILKFLNTNCMISNLVREGQIWEPPLVNLAKEYITPGTTVIDIGANIGLHTLAFAKYLGEYQKDNLLVAFEPQPLIFNILAENVKNNITNTRNQLHQCALGNKEDITYFEVPDYAKHNNTGNISIPYNIVKGEGKIPIKILTLDSFKFENVSLIKIDVEGFENEVLEGAQETISKYHPCLIVEILGGVDFNVASKDEKAYILKTIRYISGLGYTVVRFTPHDYICIPIGIPN